MSTPPPAPLTPVRVHAVLAHFFANPFQARRVVVENLGDEVFLSFVVFTDRLENYLQRHEVGTAGKCGKQCSVQHLTHTCNQRAELRMSYTSTSSPPSPVPRAYVLGPFHYSRTSPLSSCNGKQNDTSPSAVWRSGAI